MTPIRSATAAPHTPAQRPDETGEGDSDRALPWGDVVVVIAFAILVAALCALFNVSELMRRWTASWEHIQLDELPAILLAVALGLAWFAWRRYREAHQELARRRAAEVRAGLALSHVRRLSQRHITVQEQERRTIARELHDELGQYLQVVKLDAVVLRDDAARNDEAVGARASAIIDNCNHIHDVLTGLLQHLRPVGLDELGLSAALEHCVGSWRARLPGTVIDLTATDDYGDVGDSSALAIYRVVQEAMTNIAKHAHAKSVRVGLRRIRRTEAVEEICVEILDDGAGFETGGPTRGLGLIGMRERVESLGGSLEVTSTLGYGARLTARIPISSPASGTTEWQP
jgi:signal transduction histidine kinase